MAWASSNLSLSWWGYFASHLRILTFLSVTLCGDSNIATAAAAAASDGSSWMAAKATMYGGDTASTINGGACGYGDLYSNGYGSNTAAVSSALFDGGASCGACYEIQCDANAWSADRGATCLSGKKSVVVTAINFCPPTSSSTTTAAPAAGSLLSGTSANFAVPPHGAVGGASNINAAAGKGWCNPPFKHFDIAQPAFEQIASFDDPAIHQGAAAASFYGDRAAVVPVKYRRVPCEREGGMRFTINGNLHFNLVLLTNVGGSGQVDTIFIKGSNTGWQLMTRSWGSTWKSHGNMQDQSLSFQVHLSDGSLITSYEVAPPNWQFGQTFEGKQAP